MSKRMKRHNGNFFIINSFRIGCEHAVPINDKLNKKAHCHDKEIFFLSCNIFIFKIQRNS